MRPDSQQIHQRVLGQIGNLMMSAVVLSMAWAGYLPLEFTFWMVLASVAFLLAHDLLLRSKLGARLPQPHSMIAGVVTPVFFYVVLMFQLESSLLRPLFLLMGIVAALCASMAYTTGIMIVVVACLLVYDIVLIAALARWAPERMTLVVELIGLATYALVLGTMVYLTHTINTLRSGLIRRNHSLQVMTDKLNTLSRLDALTQLGNRRAAEEILNADKFPPERGSAEPAKRMGMVLFDLDYFKKINDRHGHQKGDELLRSVAEALRRTIRDSDVAARWGGEEFLLLYPGTSLNQCVQAAERVRSAIEALAREHPELEGVSASFGASVLTENHKWDAAMSEADAALYEAKSAGRNRVFPIRSDVMMSKHG